MERGRATDVITLKRRVVDEVTGFLKAPATVSRAGNVQSYTAGELGLKSLPPQKVLRLYRPASEVFAEDALASFEQVPVTVNHPPVDVNADTWRDYAVGEAFNMKRSGDFMKGTLVVRDSAAVRTVRDGKAELSCGYDFDYDDTPGVVDGQQYDGVMKNIRGNHVAIVDTARGGHQLRIADRKGRDSMETTKVKIGKVTVRVVDADAQAAHDAADAIAEAGATATRELATARDAATAERKRADDAVKALADANTAHAAALAAKDAKIAELEGKLPKPGDVERAAEQRQTVIAHAAKVVDGIDPKGKTVHAIRVAALDHALKGDGVPAAVAKALLAGVALDKADEASVAKAFDAVVAAVGDDGAVAGGGDTGAGAADIVRAMVGDDKRGARAGDAKPSGREAWIAKMHKDSRKSATAA